MAACQAWEYDAETQCDAPATVRLLDEKLMCERPSWVFCDEHARHYKSQDDWFTDGGRL